MPKLVATLIICFVPNGHGQIKEAWRLEKTVPLEVCIQMDQIFSSGGKVGVTTVRCGQITDKD